MEDLEKSGRTTIPLLPIPFIAEESSLGDQPALFHLSQKPNCEEVRPEFLVCALVQSSVINSMVCVAENYVFSTSGRAVGKEKVALYNI